MITLIHILIAFTSIGYSTYLFFAPSAGKLKISYGLVGATLATGTYLTIAKPGHLLEVCTLGLVYLGIAIVAIVSARQRLAAAE